MTDSNEIVIKEVNNQIQLGSLTATNPKDLIARASSIATELKDIVNKRKLSKVIQQREYVYVDGWTTMGAMLGVTAREVTEETKELENGDWVATAELCRVCDGSIIGRGSALVGMDEKDRNGVMTWGSRPKYARRSMAITRATGKAYRIAFSWIMSLAGYATTPAEEMDGIVDAEFTSEPAKPQPKPAAPAPNGSRPYSPEALKERIKVLADSFAGSTCTDGNRTSVRINLAEMAGGEDQYHTLLAWLVGTPHIADATAEQVLALKKWIHSTKQADDTWIADTMSIQEAKTAYTEALKAQGQETLPIN